MRTFSPFFSRVRFRVLSHRTYTQCSFTLWRRALMADCALIGFFFRSMMKPRPFLLMRKRLGNVCTQHSVEKCCMHEVANRFQRKYIIYIKWNVTGDYWRSYSPVYFLVAHLCWNINFMQRGASMEDNVSGIQCTPRGHFSFGAMVRLSYVCISGFMENYFTFYCY